MFQSCASAAREEIDGISWEEAMSMQEFDEYDPFGSYVYYIGGVRHEKCNLEEAIQNLPGDQMTTYKKLCIQARIGDAIILKAIAHDYLMGCAQKYWDRVEGQIEGESVS
jgi:hypothetical protein